MSRSRSGSHSSTVTLPPMAILPNRAVPSLAQGALSLAFLEFAVTWAGSEPCSVRNEEEGNGVAPLGTDLLAVWRSPPVGHPCQAADPPQRLRALA